MAVSTAPTPSKRNGATATRADCTLPPCAVAALSMDLSNLIDQRMEKPPESEPARSVNSECPSDHRPGFPLAFLVLIGLVDPLARASASSQAASAAALAFRSPSASVFRLDATP